MSRPSARGRVQSVPASGSHPAAEGPLAEEVDGIRNGRFRVVWQVYLSEWEVWKAYTDVQSSQIEAAWQAEAAELEVVSVDDGEAWTINLVSLTQTNNYTGTRRPIQRVLVTHR